MSDTQMSLQEARAVLWLRSNRRPLGELLDEGFLTQARLEWAAENAYDRHLKQAAAVLLEWMKRNPPAERVETETAPPPLDAGVTVKQARAIAWPFGPLKGRPMGPLVDSRELMLKDLGFAIENAWDERVRRAAAVLAAVRMDQAVKEPAPSEGPLTVVSGGRSYAQRQEIVLTFVQGLFLGALMTLFTGLFIWGIQQSARTRPHMPLAEALARPEGVLALVIVVILAMMAIGATWVLPHLAMKRLDTEIERYRQGQEGEDRVVEGLQYHLDGHWTLFRNVRLPGRSRGDIDLVLVGPPGVYVLEVKTFTGTYRNIGEHWEVQAGNRWKLLRKSPSRQAQSNAVRLADFFKADGFQQWVDPVVVWANPSSALSVENPMVAVWTLDRLAEELGNIWARKEMDATMHTRIVGKLTLLCQRQGQGAT
jgi:hypothetical protein